jgi:uncharacterized protein involved in type VI secretion and phage assembly
MFAPTDYSTPPASMFNTMQFDGFTGGPHHTMSAGVNPYGNCYLTENYSDSGKGMFAIPAINSKVIVAFLNGARGIPVILGKIHSGTEIDQIYAVGTAYPDYPNIFENTHAGTAKPPTQVSTTSAVSSTATTTAPQSGSKTYTPPPGSNLPSGSTADNRLTNQQIDNLPSSSSSRTSYSVNGSKITTTITKISPEEYRRRKAAAGY